MVLRKDFQITQKKHWKKPNMKRRSEFSSLKVGETFRKLKNQNLGLPKFYTLFSLIYFFTQNNGETGLKHHCYMKMGKESISI